MKVDKKKEKKEKRNRRLLWPKEGVDKVKGRGERGEEEGRGDEKSWERVVAGGK